MLENDDFLKQLSENETAELRSVFANTHKQEIEAACNAVYDMYKAYRKAGFTSDQAMQLVCSTIASASNGKN